MILLNYYHFMKTNLKNVNDQIQRVLFLFRCMVCVVFLKMVFAYNPLEKLLVFK